MDGQMSEEIRIGVLVRSRMEQLVREAGEKFYADPKNKGKIFNGGWRQPGSGITYSGFGSTIIEMAGGIDRLILEWEFVRG